MSGSVNNGAYADDDIVYVFTQRITTPFHIYKNVFTPNGLHHFARHQLAYGSGQDRKFTYNFYERFGGYYGGSLNEFRARANYRPNAKFSFSASETWGRFRLLLLNGNFSVVLASLQANYSFYRFLTFTSLVQMDTSNTQAVSANLRPEPRPHCPQRGFSKPRSIRQMMEIPTRDRIYKPASCSIVVRTGSQEPGFKRTIRTRRTDIMPRRRRRSPSIFLVVTHVTSLRDIFHRKR